MNRMTLETTMYNPMRANRPGSQAAQSRDYVDRIIDESRHECDFCNTETATVRNNTHNIDNTRH